MMSGLDSIRFVSGERKSLVWGFDSYSTSLLYIDFGWVGLWLAGLGSGSGSNAVEICMAQFLVGRAGHT